MSRDNSPAQLSLLDFADALSQPSVSPLGSGGNIRRALRYAFYDWTREMPRSKRLITWTGILLQGYAIFAVFVRSLIWPWVWPIGGYLYPAVLLLYFLGYILINGMLTSEFVRKTQLESDQIAARQIQQTLVPQERQELPGYDVEIFYKPFREVGGDYCDLIELPGNRSLLVLVDVAGKGVAAALLAANIQALVRSIAAVDINLLTVARQINQHLSRYAPPNRFATAIFLVLRRESGEMSFVNAGHNAPIVYSSQSTTFLSATGLPLGLFREANYELGRAILQLGDTILFYTDGLTDSIAGSDPENVLCDALASRSGTTMSTLTALINPEFNEDDVTILLVKRNSEFPFGGKPAQSSQEVLSPLL